MDLSRIEWRTSSYSSSNGGQCVEVGWRKSSYSSSNGGSCVEVAAVSRAVAVRDSKDADGPALVFSEDAWDVFIGHVKDGRAGLA